MYCLNGDGICEAIAINPLMIRCQVGYLIVQLQVNTIRFTRL